MCINSDGLVSIDTYFNDVGTLPLLIMYLLYTALPARAVDQHNESNHDRHTVHIIVVNVIHSHKQITKNFIQSNK